MNEVAALRLKSRRQGLNNGGPALLAANRRLHEHQAAEAERWRVDGCAGLLAEALGAATKPAAGPRPDFIGEVQALLGGPAACCRKAVSRWVGVRSPRFMREAARAAAKHGRAPAAWWMAAMGRGRV